MTRSWTKKGKKRKDWMARDFNLENRSSFSTEETHIGFFSRAKSAANPFDSKSNSNDRKSGSSQPDVIRISYFLPSLERTAMIKCGKSNIRSVNSFVNSIIS